MWPPRVVGTQEEVSRWIGEERGMEEKKETTEALKDMLKLVEGLRSINVFYRIGKRPTEKALDAVEDADARIASARSALALATGQTKQEQRKEQKQ